VQDLILLLKAPDYVSGLAGCLSADAWQICSAEESGWALTSGIGLALRQTFEERT
jgi:hypothetical protein